MVLGRVWSQSAKKKQILLTWPLINWVFVNQNVVSSYDMFTIKLTFLQEISPTQWLLSQCCGYWWSGHQKQRCWVRMHSIMTSSNGNIFRVIGPLWGESTWRWPVVSPQKGHWRGPFVFSLNCALTNDWAHNRVAGDLRRQRTYYDVSVKVSSWNMIQITAVVYLIHMGPRTRTQCEEIKSSWC